MKNKVTIILIVIGILIFSLTGYKVYKDFFNTEVKVKETKRLELYGYTLSNTDTDVFKEKYNELEKVLNDKKINFDDYARILSELFVIDFYTLSNKITSTDIGGTEYIFPSSVENFKLNAGDTIYKYIEINLDGERKQKLPEVVSTEIINTENGNYKLDDKNFDSYEIKISIKYKEDLGYPENVELTLIKDNNKLYIVEVN